MNKTGLIILSIGLVISAVIVFSMRSNNPVEVVQNVAIKEGIQYITIDAKGGYSPRVSSAKAGVPTKLIVKTGGTFDCSSSLVIRSLKYQDILPQNGETVIDVGIPVAGEPLQGVCSMGMYSFKVDFS